MNTEALATYTNPEYGITARVFEHVQGFSVSLRDDDSGETVDTISIYPTFERADAQAQELVR